MPRRSLIPAIAAVLLFLAAPAEASHPRLPSPDAFRTALQTFQFSQSDFARMLASGSVRATRCDVTSTSIHCRCVRGIRAGVLFRANEITLDAEGGMRAAGALSVERSAWWAFGEIEADDGFQVRDVRRSSSGRGFRADSATFAASRVRLASLAFGEFAGLSPSSSECGEAPDLSAERASARAAVWRDGSWNISGFSQGAVTLGETETAATGNNGVLPPTIRYRDDFLEFEAAYYLAPISAAVVASASPGEWYGGGIGVVTRGGDRVRWLDVQLRWDVARDSLEPIAIGEARWGDGLTHLSTDLEHPGDGRFWSVRAVERDALFRAWRLSETGISLSGAGHQMALDVASETPLDAEPTTWTVGAAWATTFETAEVLRTDVAVDHRTRTSEPGSAHSTTGLIRASVPIGDAGSALVQPALMTAADFGAVPVDDGFEARTVGMMMAELDARLSFTGEFEAIQHRISPRVRLGRELFGLDSETTVSDPAIGQRFERPREWTYGAAVLEQTVSTRFIELGFPLGVYVSSTSGDDIFADPRPYGRIRLSWGRGGVTGGAVCVDACSSVAWNAGSHAELFGAVRLSYGASYARPSDLQITMLDEVFRSPLQTLLLGGLVTAETQRSVTHHAGLGLRGSLWGARIGGSWDTDAGDRSGATAEVSYSMPDLGWGVALQGAVRPAVEDVGLFLGLRTN